jgi:hypothetical protein
LPFSTWTLTNFFDNIPVDLKEAALRKPYLIAGLVAGAI